MPGVIGGAGDIGAGHHGKNHGDALLHRGHPDQGGASQHHEDGRVLGPDLFQRLAGGPTKLRDEVTWRR